MRCSVHLSTNMLLLNHDLISRFVLGTNGNIKLTIKIDFIRHKIHCRDPRLRAWCIGILKTRLILITPYWMTLIGVEFQFTITVTPSGCCRSGNSCDQHTLEVRNHFLSLSRRFWEMNAIWAYHIKGGESGSFRCRYLWALIGDILAKLHVDQDDEIHLDWSIIGVCIKNTPTYMGPDILPYEDDAFVELIDRKWVHDPNKAIWERLDPSDNICCEYYSFDDFRY